MSHDHSHLTPGSAEYEDHVRGEIAHYVDVFQSEEAQRTLMQPTPSAWQEVEVRSAELVRRIVGVTPTGYLTKRLREFGPGAAFLSLGSGPGGVELSVAQHTPQATYLCMDISEPMLDLGRQRAKELGVPVSFEQSDLNTVRLPPSSFDLIWCHAALHHVLELERLAVQMQQALKPGGIIVAVDVVSRNGFLLWPETKAFVEKVWQVLPARYRMNHTGYGEKRIDASIWEANTAAHSMECIRSEDILPVFRAHFREDVFIPYHAFVRRFFDTMYGPNFDLSRDLDRATFDWLWALDREMILSGVLRPETFFGVYSAPTRPG